MHHDLAIALWQMFSVVVPVAATVADRTDLMKELMTMQSLGSHPQIVTLLGVCNTAKSMCLVMEYCPGGDLLTFLRKVCQYLLAILHYLSRLGAN